MYINDEYGDREVYVWTRNENGNEFVGEFK